ncbi:hypothetical protein FRB91_009740 [Serendipita sp. 411]|nr:hypothetical protein FRB91_009740 [Serendipita sp. 411]
MEWNGAKNEAGKEEGWRDRLEKGKEGRRTSCIYELQRKRRPPTHPPTHACMSLQRPSLILNLPARKRRGTRTLKRLFELVHSYPSIRDFALIVIVTVTVTVGKDEADKRWDVWTEVERALG